MSAEVVEKEGALDAHVLEMVGWHFSAETGCPYWLERAEGFGFDPVKEVTCFADMVKFDHFDDEVLRKEDPARFVPKAFAGRPYNVFETGGTTGMPKQRIGWEDFRTDYSEFSDHYPADFFPQGANWLMVGPTGPRRLRLAIEHLADGRQKACPSVTHSGDGRSPSNPKPRRGAGRDQPIPEPSISRTDPSQRTDLFQRAGQPLLKPLLKLVTCPDLLLFQP